MTALDALEAEHQRLLGELADAKRRLAAGRLAAASTRHDRATEAADAAIARMEDEHARRVAALRRAADDEVDRILGDGRARAAVVAASAPGAAEGTP